jgi:hypothetical protein
MVTGIVSLYVWKYGLDGRAGEMRKSITRSVSDFYTSDLKFWG